MPGPLARQTTTPSLPEGEEDNAGRGPGIALKTVVAPVRRCYLHFSKPKFNFQVYFDYFIQTKRKFAGLFLVILLQDSPLFFLYRKEIRFFF